MFCPNCGNQIQDKNDIYCTQCGNPVKFNNLNVHPVYNNIDNKQSINNNRKKMFNISLIIVFSFALVLIFIGVIIIGRNAGENYYFSDNSYTEKEEIIEKKQDVTSKKSKYKTVIVTDNFYEGVQLLEKDDAYDLISSDSVSQKKTCSKEIIDIENEIISKYNVTAVNLCELDVEFAKELSKVFEKVYIEYPEIRNYLTNLTLINAPVNENYIAAFMAVFPFASADTISSYPWVFKTQVLLNTKYFLNPERMQIGIDSSSKSGHFPPNATIYSPLAHELGHYISFIAMMKYYQTDSVLLVDNNNINTFYKIINDFSEGDFSLLMIDEAYKTWKQDTGKNMEFDIWRATISSYAVAKDNNGDYIYDETIAEAFHDVYLNGDEAKEASKYIIDVLKSKLER